MTTLQAATRALLTGDTTLAALATGGIHDPESLGRQELELKDVTASGSPLVKPAVFLRWTTQDPMSATALRAVRGFVEAYFYQDTGYATIQQMRQRVWQLLDQQRVTVTEPSGVRHCAFVWAGDVIEQQDDSLGGASMERSRYEVHYTRR